MINFLVDERPAVRRGSVQREDDKLKTSVTGVGQQTSGSSTSENSNTEAKTTASSSSTAAANAEQQEAPELQKSNGSTDNCSSTPQPSSVAAEKAKRLVACLTIVAENA